MFSFIHLWPQKKQKVLFNSGSLSLALSLSLSYFCNFKTMFWSLIFLFQNFACDVLDKLWSWLIVKKIFCCFAKAQHMNKTYFDIDFWETFMWMECHFTQQQNDYSDSSLGPLHVTSKSQVVRQTYL